MIFASVERSPSPRWTAEVTAPNFCTSHDASRVELSRLFILACHDHGLRQHYRPVDEQSEDLAMAQDRGCDLVQMERPFIRKCPDADALGRIPRQTIQPRGRWKRDEDKASGTRVCEVCLDGA